MHATAAFPAVGVDLSKHVFELAVADDQWRIVERARLSRSQFERWFANRAVGSVVMESCGSAHHWGRWLAGLGIAVTLLPAQYVRAYDMQVTLAPLANTARYDSLRAAGVDNPTEEVRHDA